MATQDNQKESTPRPKSIFACLSEGFDVVASHPALMLPPLLLDVFLWLGPRLVLPFNAADLLDLWTSLGTQEVSLAELQNFWEHYNVFYVLSAGPVFGIPSLIARRMPWAAPWPRATLALSPDLMSLLVWGALLLVGLALATGYLYSIVQTIRELIASPLPPMLPLPRLVFYMMGLLARLLPFVLGGLGLTALMSSGAVPSGLGAFLMMTLTFVGLYLAAHLILAVPPLFLQRRRPVEALRDAVLLMRVDFLEIVALYGLIFVLYEGLNFLWMVPSDTSWLLLVGLGGHAFIATGLTATLFVFYVERLAYVRALQEALANTNRQVHVSRQS